MTDSHYLQDKLHEFPMHTHYSYDPLDGQVLVTVQCGALTSSAWISVGEVSSAIEVARLECVEEIEHIIRTKIDRLS